MKEMAIIALRSWEKAQRLWIPQADLHLEQDPEIRAALEDLLFQWRSPTSGSILTIRSMQSQPGDAGLQISLAGPLINHGLNLFHIQALDRQLPTQGVSIGLESHCHPHPHRWGCGRHRASTKFGCYYRSQWTNHSPLHRPQQSGDCPHSMAPEDVGQTEPLHHQTIQVRLSV